MKNKLKEAKELIVKGNFTEALSGILQEDETNYNALVFAGKCQAAREDEIAAEHLYMKAISMDPENSLAYQGLSKLQSVSNEAKVAVFPKLLQITKLKPDESFDILLQLAVANLGAGVDYRERALDMFIVLLDSKEKLITVCQAFTSSIIFLTPSPPPMFDLVVKMIKQLFNLENGDVNETEDCIEQCLRIGEILRLHFPLDRVISVSRNAFEDHPENRIVAEFVVVNIFLSYACRGILSVDELALLSKVGSFFETNDSDSEGNEADNYSEIYSKLYDIINCAIVDVNYEDAVEIVQEIYTDNQLYRLSNLLQASVRLCQARLYLATENLDKCRAELLQMSNLKSGLNEAPIRHIKAKILLTKKPTSAVAFVQAKTLLDDIRTENSDWVDQNDVLCDLIDCFVGLDELDEASTLLDEGSPTPSQHFLESKASLRYKQSKFEDAEELLVSANDINANCKSVLYKLALTCWQLGKFDKSFPLFLQVAKLDPLNASSYVYLGHYYDQVQNNKEKAVRCYDRALQYDPSLIDIASKLVDICRFLDRPSDAVPALRKVCSVIVPNAENPLSIRLWVVYGQLLLIDEDLDTLIDAMHTASRFLPSSPVFIELSAEAYRLRGSYECAIHGFERAIEAHELIESKSEAVKYCMYQVGSSQVQLDRFEEAIESFENVLDFDEKHFPSLLGIAEALYLQGLQYVNGGRTERAAFCWNRAMPYLHVAVALRSDISITWKLIADICLAIGKHSGRDNQRCFLEHPVVVELSAGLENVSVFLCAANAYTKVLNILNECAETWHDLGVACLHAAMDCSVEEQKADLFSKALAVIGKAVILDPNQTDYYNDFGVLALIGEKNAAFAQHCLICALICDSKNETAWSNIGFLYLQHEDYELANLAFGNAQSCLPTFPNGWIGQAIIAERVHPKESLDLFRVAAQCGYHPVALFGYPRHVLRFLTDPDTETSSTDYDYHIVAANAVSFARDCLLHYTSIIQSLSCRFNLHYQGQEGASTYGQYMLGCCEEMDGCVSVAEKAFECALHSLKDTSALKQDDLKLCLCRIAAKLDRPEVVRKIIPRLKSDVLSVNVALAVAYARVGRYDQAEKLFSDSYYEAQANKLANQLMTALVLLSVRAGHSEKANDLSEQITSAQESASMFAHIVIALTCEKPSFLKILQLFDKLGVADNDSLFWVSICLQYFSTFSTKIPMWFSQSIAFRYPHLGESWQLVRLAFSDAWPEYCANVKQMITNVSGISVIVDCFVDLKVGSRNCLYSLETLAIKQIKDASLREGVQRFNAN